MFVFINLRRDFIGWLSINEGDKREILVRAIRFVALLCVIAIVFLATPTVELRPFATLLPDDLIGDSPFLQRFQQWVAEDLAQISLLLTSCAAVTFGLLAIPWPYTAPSRLSADILSKRTARSQAPAHFTLHQTTAGQQRGVRHWFGGFVIFLALGSTALSLFRLQQIGDEDSLVHLFWILGILFLLTATGILTDSALVNRTHGMAAQPTKRSFSSWPTLLVVLFFALLLYGWQLTTVPATIDDDLAGIGLQALAMAEKRIPVRLFAPLPTLSQPNTHLFTLAITPTALLTWITGDLLLSTRLMGLFAALFCAVGTWLVGVELFMRPADAPTHRAPIEDDGQSLGILAAMLLVTNMGIIYFSRYPLLLEATAWGIFGCWTLLRGMRMYDRLVLTLSGILLGISLLFHASALAFLLIGLLWWISFGIVRIGLVPHRSNRGRIRRSYWFNCVLWVAGIGVVVAPYVTHLYQESVALSNQFPVSLGEKIPLLLTNFMPPAEVYPAPLYNTILLPFLPLALGVLLFNCDRRQGWMLVTWLFGALLSALLLYRDPVDWTLLLPLIPAMTLLLAFTLDRLRVTLLRVGGLWSYQFLNYLLLGLVLWIGFHNGITYYSFALRQIDQPSATGYLLREHSPQSPILLLHPVSEAATGTELLHENLQLRFLTNDTIDQAAGNNVVIANELPTTIATGTVVIIPATEMAWKTSLDARTFVELVAIRRDLQANPLLYVYHVMEPEG